MLKISKPGRKSDCSFRSFAVFSLNSLIFAIASLGDKSSPNGIFELATFLCSTASLTKLSNAFSTSCCMLCLLLFNILSDSVIVIRNSCHLDLKETNKASSSSVTCKSNFFKVPYFASIGSKLAIVSSALALDD